MRGKDEVSAPYSKVKHDLVNVLVNEGYLKSCKKVEEDNNKASINITLKYFNSKVAAILFYYHLFFVIITTNL